MTNAIGSGSVNLTVNVRKTSYGVIPVSELEQHLKQEIER